MAAVCGEIGQILRCIFPEDNISSEPVVSALGRALATNNYEALQYFFHYTLRRILYWIFGEAALLCVRTFCRPFFLFSILIVT